MRIRSTTRSLVVAGSVAALLLAIASVAIAAPATETDDDTLVTFGYDEVNHVLIANVSGADTPYDCTLDATYKTAYGEVVDALVPVDMLLGENLDPVEFGNRPADLVGDDFEPAPEPTTYSGSEGDCGLTGVVVAGPNGQINHGQVMKAFRSLIDMKGHGCINRIIAQSDLGKGDQQLKTSDVDPSFEISEEGTVTFLTEATRCGHGRDKGDDHPSNNASDKKPKRDKNPNRGPKK